MTIDTLKQASLDHLAQGVNIEAMADVLHDAAIRYAGGHETDWREVAKQALATPPQAREAE